MLSAQRSASGSAYMSPWRRLAPRNAGFLQLDPGKPQHFRRTVDADRAVGPGREQLQHPAGAGTDVEQRADRPVGQQAGNRPLDLCIGDVQRADALPGRGMGFEIAARCLRPIGADRIQPRRIGGEQLLGLGIETLAELEQAFGSLRLGQLEIDPAAFLAPADQARVGKDADVARYARLALAQQLGQFADRQLHRPQQREDPQPRRIGQRLEKRGKLEVPGHRLRI